MQYTFYNTQTQAHDAIRNAPYLVDGQPPILPDNIIELSVITDAYPAVTGLNKLQSVETVDLNAKTLTKSWNVVPITDLTEAKNWKLNQIALQYSDAIKSGITPQGMSNALAATDADRNKFSQLVGLLREAEEMQPDDASKTAFRASQITIADKDGAVIALSVNSFRAAIISYGMQINTIWGNYSAARAAVQNAQTVDEINSMS